MTVERVELWYDAWEAEAERRGLARDRDYWANGAEWIEAERGGEAVDVAKSRVGQANGGRLPRLTSRCPSAPPKGPGRVDGARR